MNRILFLLATAIAGIAQTPSPESLLKRAQEALIKQPNLAMTFESREQQAGPGIPARPPRAIPAKVWVKSGKIRHEIRQENQSLLMVNDGQFTYTYSSLQNQYTKVPSFQGATTLTPNPIEALERNLKAVGNKKVSSDTLKIGSRSFSCWLVEASYPKVALPQSADLAEVSFRFWLDKATGIQLRSFQQVSVRPAGAPGKVDQISESLVTQWDDKSPIPPALFRFNPPAGAKQATQRAQ
jgi:outer membrane lipoprotein-sorting protein